MQSSILNSVLSSSSSSSCGCCCSSSAGSSVRPVNGGRSYTSVGMRPRGMVASPVVLRAESNAPFGRSEGKRNRVAPPRAERAGAPGGAGGLDEKVKELSSEQAVESMQGVDRSARVMVDDLKPVEHPGTTGWPTSARELELQAEEKASDADESLGGKGRVLDVASDSAVDPEHNHENTIATADELAPELGLSVEDLTVALEDRAEEASKRDAELAKPDAGAGAWDGGVGQVVDVGEESGVTGEDEMTRDAATEKILDVAREGIEVLKWAVEGITAAGANSREGFEVAKELLDKRMKSFNLAAEETKEVSAQLSEVAVKKYEELQGSASKFSEELQVQIEDKKAADELKPDSETNPLAQLSQGFQATIQTATKEDGPLAKLGQGVKDTVAKVSAAGQDLADSKSPLPETAAQEPEEESDFLVPVGKKEGFFQDLAPANGSSPKPGDRSMEASDILGDDHAPEQVKEGQPKVEQEYEGFFGDIPVDRSASRSRADEGETSTNTTDASASKQETTTTSGDASATVKEDYEHEVGNDQLESSSKSGQETSGLDASIEHDSSMVQPSVKGEDGMGIGPDE
ncbi:hypothetical protein MPTK2_3g02290 [Marchantia polymorpha subsp. ruderalis]